MNALFVLDAGVVGLLTHPAATAERAACRDWMARSVAAGARFVVPEIADYEVRREVTVITTNVGHLSLFVNASDWRET